MSPSYCIVRRDRVGGVIEGGFFSREAAERACIILNRETDGAQYIVVDQRKVAAKAKVQLSDFEQGLVDRYAIAMRKLEATTAANLRQAETIKTLRAERDTLKEKVRSIPAIQAQADSLGRIAEEYRATIATLTAALRQCEAALDPDSDYVAQEAADCEVHPDTIKGRILEAARAALAKVGP